jgi:hypothetical protein
MKISKNKAKELINNSKGKFFSLANYKKDSTQRLYGSSKLNLINYKGYINIYEMNKKSFRNVDIETMYALNINKKRYEVVNG